MINEPAISVGLHNIAQGNAMQHGAASHRPDEILHGGSIIAQIVASGVDFVVSVPDITTSEGLLRPLAEATAPRLIRVCKEDEGVGICAGLSYTGNGRCC